MLDIISMTILLFLLIGLPIILIIIGGNKNKSQQEIEAELKEQSDYLREQMRKKEKYNLQHVQAYSIIALNNLLNSANDITLENMKMIIEPLDLLHTKKDVIEYSEKLLKNKNN